MAYGQSVIQDFTDNLIMHLRDRPGLETVVISDGPPPASQLQAKEWLMFGDVTGKQEWASIARTRLPKNETFTIEVLISVVAAATASSPDVQPALNRRCLEIFHELEQELKENVQQDVGPQSGHLNPGYVIVSAINEPIKLEKRANDTAREASMVIGLKVQARI